MTLQEIKSLLDKTGYPVAYDHFKKPQQTPYICYTSPFTNNFIADGYIYKVIKHIQIELYTENKDEVAEGVVENILKDFIFTKSETYIDSVKVYQIIYEIEV